MNFDLFVCTVYKGKSDWDCTKIQQRFFLNVKCAVNFGGKCVKKYYDTPFVKFAIKGVRIVENDVTEILTYNTSGECEIKNPATFQMLKNALAG